ncbi:NUDIX hydrolase domain-like protein [Macrophomina phaseolina]|uniref:NUDIX hydrolase domain-like protein n=1 Tax=Macrophomina phaseolina TaxID=35725 RepID=A0ABQ8FY77_9PEZI|nr:NUDIX hydrolase domain-like protein [Macrophomina phaseolina]
MPAEAALHPETVPSEKPFTVPEDLAGFSVSSHAYLQRHTRWQVLAVGALVFNGDRLLLVQRSTTERAFPNLWEVPGGSVDPEDETILHAVSRELQEETGLHVTAINHAVGTGVEFGTGSGERQQNWLKLAFEVETAEAIPIRLDPIEHQNYLWVSEDEVVLGEANGRRLEFMTADQRAMMLEGFRLRRAQGW